MATCSSILAWRILWTEEPGGLLSLGSHRVGHDLVTKPPLKQETWVQFLSQEDTPEEGMTTHSSILAWRILWTEEPGGLQRIGNY